jgi:hypothetical protein
MEQEGPRYAIYFVPAADSALYRFGSAVLQYDCYTGHAVSPPDELASDSDTWSDATAQPRRYGFHATLKAPFHLSRSCDEAQLVSAVQSFAALGRRSVFFNPVLRMLGGFIAVLSGRPDPAIDALAADCTTIFDAFRAPMSPQERARRVAAGLNQRQFGNLERWGYPYLFADFRFHMMLTGKVPASRRDDTLATLRAVLQRICGDGPVPIDQLMLVRQDSPDASFSALSVAPLCGER